MYCFYIRQLLIWKISSLVLITRVLYSVQKISSFDPVTVEFNTFESSQNIPLTSVLHNNQINIMNIGLFLYIPPSLQIDIHFLIPCALRASDGIRFVTIFTLIDETKRTELGM